jgi:hypothetical protein
MLSYLCLRHLASWPFDPPTMQDLVGSPKTAVLRRAGSDLIRFSESFSDGRRAAAVGE